MTGSGMLSSGEIKTEKKPSQWKKIIIGVVVLVAVIAIISAFAGGTGNILTTTSTYQIAVSGTTGLEFSGSYMVTDTGGSSTSQSVSGTVPQTYTVEGSMVSVVFQNQGDSGTLTVKVLKDSEVIKEATTTASYGVVSVATD